MGAWTCAKDDPPPLVGDDYYRESEPVLATDGRRIHVAYMMQYSYAGEWDSPVWKIQGQDYYTFDDVTHWHPLPALP